LLQVVKFSKNLILILARNFALLVERFMARHSRI